MPARSIAVNEAGTSQGFSKTLLTVMFGFCFSKMATSASHSLCCTGELAGGAQSTLIVTWPPLLPPLAAGLLEQAAAASPRAAKTVKPASWRRLEALGSLGPCRR